MITYILFYIFSGCFRVNCLEYIAQIDVYRAGLDTSSAAHTGSILKLVDIILEFMHDPLPVAAELGRSGIMP